VAGVWISPTGPDLGAGRGGEPGRLGHSGQGYGFQSRQHVDPEPLGIEDLAVMSLIPGILLCPTRGAPGCSAAAGITGMCRTLAGAFRELGGGRVDSLVLVSVQRIAPLR
jgi:hypothetical protein